MMLSKTYRILLYTLIISVLVGVMCEYFYFISPQIGITTESFQQQLDKKEKEATKTLDKLKDIIIHASIDSLNKFEFPENDITYYYYHDNQLVFWSDNHYELSKLKFPNSQEWKYYLLPNAHCITKIIPVDTSFLVAIIKIKNNYQYENDNLNNNYSNGFDVDKNVEILIGNERDKNAVFSVDGQYLFTLSDAGLSIYNFKWAFAGLISFTILFFIFLFLYANISKLTTYSTLSLKFFIRISLFVSCAVGISLYFNIPSLIYWNKLFSPFQYASNPFLASISHLTIATAFFITMIYLFYFKVSIGKRYKFLIGIVLQISFVLYFLLVYNVLSGLVYHSSIQLSILKFNDFSFASIWIHFLILVWGVGLVMLFYKTHNWFKSAQLLQQAILGDLLLVIIVWLLAFLIFPENSFRIFISQLGLNIAFYIPYFVKRKLKISTYLFVWMIAYTTFFVVNSLLFSEDKKMNKYKVLAQNIMINGNTENDRMADILLEELDVQIENDAKIKQYATNIDSVTVANNYLNNKYLRGFWSKYDMRLTFATPHTDIYKQYMILINQTGTKLKNTHFYSVPVSYNDMSYLGVFPALISSDSSFFFMEFYPRKNFKSYSFPNLLETSTPDIQSQLNISIAIYTKNKLMYSSGQIDFPENRNWIPLRKNEFFKLNFKNKVFYVYNPDKNNQLLITEQNTFELSTYIMYFAYTFIVFYIFCWLLLWMYEHRNNKVKIQIGLTTKFQYASITLLIFSFIGIFYVSVDFIRQKYQEEQIQHLESKKKYLQKSLQEMYYWTQDLSTIDPQRLNFNLQELSYMYQSDIHVYDNNGVLIGSSQPVIFNKNLISKQIAPNPYFSENSALNQYEHIGELSYLTGYTDLYNGDYLQIGFIAVPQFFSQEELQGEIESFLSVIIHIYLIIILLAVLLSIFIGKQLSSPLILIENKLKKMQFGHKNEKIDYQLNDEIGQLVAQYNRTIDELDKSAKLLAQSERESAWKSMARQIAHEINNPLTPMKLTIQQLQRTKLLGDDRFDDYFEKSTVTLIEQIDNLSRIAGTFSNFARLPEAQFVRLDIAAKLYSVVQLFVNNNEGIQIQFVGKIKDVFVYADPEQMVQVFNNLMKNSIQAISSDSNGIVSVKIENTISEICIEISDNGSGIPDEIQEKLFTPNFTTKNTGMGLGLTISKNIIELSGGTISFKTVKDMGTIFKVTLPMEI